MKLGLRYGTAGPELDDHLLHEEPMQQKYARNRRLFEPLRSGR